MSKSLERLLSTLSPDEQRELEKFAVYLLLRRKISTEQILQADISSEELMRWTILGWGFDWLEDEPDLYSLEDGEPVKWPQKNS
jgi:hypothetical protein